MIVPNLTWLNCKAAHRGHTISLGAFPPIYFGDKTPDAAHRMCSFIDLNGKPSVAVYKAIGIACGFVVSVTKKLVQQTYTQINLLIVSYALNTFRDKYGLVCKYHLSEATTNLI